MKVNGRTYTVVGSLQSKGGGFGGNQDGISILPITTFFEGFGSANRSVNIAVQPESRAAYGRTESAAFGARRAARGLKPGPSGRCPLPLCLGRGGLSVCAVIGVGFGLYPAWKAASLDPIEALRFE